MSDHFVHWSVDVPKPALRLVLVPGLLPWLEASEALDAAVLEVFVVLPGIAFVLVPLE